MIQYNCSCVCSTRCVCVGDILPGPAAILLVGEWSGGQSVGVGGSTPETAALPTHHLLPAFSLLGLRATWPPWLQPTGVLPEVRTADTGCPLLLLHLTRVPFSSSFYTCEDFCMRSQFWKSWKCLNSETVDSKVKNGILMWENKSTSIMCCSCMTSQWLTKLN